MLTVTIEPADNGVVKVTYDDSINGAEEEHISRVVYDFDQDDTKENVVRFLEDLTLDLGIETGSTLDPYQMVLTTRIGNPNKVDVDEIKDEVRALKQEIKRLEAAIKK
jgi:hypothetical protein